MSDLWILCSRLSGTGNHHVVNMLDLKDIEVTTEQGAGRISFFDGTIAEVVLSGNPATGQRQKDLSFRYPEDFEDHRIKATDAFIEYAIGTDIRLWKSLHVIRFKLRQFPVDKRSGNPKEKDRRAYYSFCADADRLEKELARNAFDLAKHRCSLSGDLRTLERFQRVRKGTKAEEMLTRIQLEHAHWLCAVLDETVARNDVTAEIDVWAMGDLVYAYLWELLEEALMVQKLPPEETAIPKFSVDTFLRLNPLDQGSPFERFVADPGALDTRIAELCEFRFGAARPDLQEKGPDLRRSRPLMESHLILSTERIAPDQLGEALYQSFCDGIQKIRNKL